MGTFLGTCRLEKPPKIACNFSIIHYNRNPNANGSRVAILPAGHQHGNITMPLHVEGPFVMMKTSKHLWFSPMTKIDTADCISASKTVLPPNA